MLRNPVRWFEIYVQDIARAKRFYESLFNVRLEKLESPDIADASSLELWSFPSSREEAGCSGALVKMEGVCSGGGGTIVYFGSDDCAIEEKRIRELGGTVHRAKTPIGQYGFIVLAVDTEGNMFGIHSMK